MQTLYAESDTVRLAVPTVAQVIGGQRNIELPAGTRGIVVQVNVSGTQCQSYEVEFEYASGQWAVANVPEANLVAAS